MGVEQQFHFPATSEEWNGLSSDRNQSPCARISSGSACAKLCKKHSKPPQFDPITARHCCGNLCKNGIDDLLGVLPIEMRVFDRYPVNEFGFYHSKALGRSEGAEDRRAGQAALVPPAIQRPPSPGLTFEDRALQPDHSSRSL